MALQTGFTSPFGWCRNAKHSLVVPWQLPFGPLYPVSSRDHGGFMAVGSVVAPGPRRSAAFLAGSALAAALLPAALPSSSHAQGPSGIVDPAIAHLRGTVGVIVQAAGQAAPS